MEQPVRRAAGPVFSRHSDSGSDSKHDATASLLLPRHEGHEQRGIQTISDCSVQTEPDQLPRSPAIHITAVARPQGGDRQVHIGTRRRLGAARAWPARRSRRGTQGVGRAAAHGADRD